MFKNLSALSFGIFLSVVALFALEGALRVANQLHLLPVLPVKWLPVEPNSVLSQRVLHKLEEARKNPDLAHMFKPIELLVEDSSVDYSEKHVKGIRILPGRAKAHRSIVKSKFGTLLYDVNYDFDEHGRRKTVLQNESSNNLVLMGCSYTFGEGLPQGSTIADNLSKIMPHQKVFNLGYPATGPNDHLFHLTNGNEAHLLSGITPGNGHLIFIFINSHIERVRPRLSRLKFGIGTAGERAIYDFEDGKLKYLGPMLSAMKVRFSLFEFLHKSFLLDYFQIDIPPRVSQLQKNLFIAILNEIKDIFATQKGFTRFTLLFFPGVPKESVEELSFRLQTNGWNFLDYSGADLSPLPNKGFIPIDHHPTELTIRILSQLLAEDLSAKP